MMFGTSQQMKLMNNMTPIYYDDNIVEEFSTFKYLGSEKFTPNSRL